MVAAADRAEVMAKWIPLEKRGSMNAVHIMSPRQERISKITSGVANNSVAIASIRGCRIAVVTRFCYSPFHEHPLVAYQVNEMWRK